MDAKLFNSLPTLAEVKDEISRLRSRVKLLHKLKEAIELNAEGNSKTTEPK